jgi:MFS transporter, PPP family, 3-phenylpropionic acid transporter
MDRQIRHRRDRLARDTADKTPNNAARIVTIGLMMRAEPPIVNDLFAPRLAAFYAAFFAAAGLYLPFFPVWLAAKGLDAAAIGIVLGVPQFLRVAAIPAGTRLADRTGALQGPLVVASLATLAGLLLVALADGFWPILCALALMTVFSAPVLPLGDAYSRRAD